MASTLLIQLVALVAFLGIAHSAGLYEQCAGEGYGTFPCTLGLTCFRRNKWYSSCQHSCPLNLGWECEAYVVRPPVSTIAAGWDQCGGEGWLGATVCAAGFACYARSIHYAQCRPVNDCPAGWGCPGLVVATTPAPVGPIVLAAYSKCNGLANTICAPGSGCFRANAAYSECRPYCPATWACETDLAGPNEQCGGENYVGLTRCAEGLRCFVRSKWYAHCAATCPGADWIC